MKAPPPPPPPVSANRVLIAEDDPIQQTVLAHTLRSWGYDCQLVQEGPVALQVLQSESPPHLAIIDWMMPGMDGPEICRQVRAVESDQPPYIILLTARSDADEIVYGLESGANDYMIKPFRPLELRARLGIARRMIELQQKLAERVVELEAAIAQVKELRGLLPICMYCKKIRDDQDYWHQIEAYISEHTEARFSHGICPQCYQRELAQYVQPSATAPTGTEVSRADTP